MHLKQQFVQTAVFEQQDAVGSATVEHLPGNSDIAVIGNVWIPPDQRGKGIGKRQHAERLAILKDQLHFPYALCTVNNSNPAELQIVKQFGWELLKQLEHFSIYWKEL